MEIATPRLVKFPILNGLTTVKKRPMDMAVRLAREAMPAIQNRHRWCSLSLVTCRCRGTCQIFYNKLANLIHKSLNSRLRIHKKLQF